MDKQAKEPKCIRVARIECETSRNFRGMHRMAATHPKIAGARNGELGEFFVTDEYRFRLLCEAYGGKEMC